MTCAHCRQRDAIDWRTQACAVCFRRVVLARPRPDREQVLADLTASSPEWDTEDIWD